MMQQGVSTAGKTTMATATRCMTFDECLAYNDATDKRYEWIAGARVKMPTEKVLLASRFPAESGH